MDYNETPYEGETMPIYSFGINSILKLELTEEEADGYNRFVQAFFDAQEAHLARTGTRWEPTEPLWIKNDEDIETHNLVARKLTKAIESIDQEKTPIEIDEDFLIKN